MYLIIPNTSTYSPREVPVSNRNNHAGNKSVAEVNRFEPAKVSTAGLGIAKKFIEISEANTTCPSTAPLFGRVHSFLQVHADLYSTLSTLYKTAVTLFAYEVPGGRSWLGAAQLLSVIPSAVHAKEEADGLMHSSSIHDTEGMVTGGMKMGNHVAVVLTGLLFIPLKGVDIAMTFTASKALVVMSAALGHISMALTGVVLFCTAAVAVVQLYCDIDFFFLLRKGEEEKYLREQFSVTAEEEEVIWENVLKELSKSEETELFKTTIHSEKLVTSEERRKTRLEIDRRCKGLSPVQKKTLLRLLTNEREALKEKKEAYLVRRLGNELVEKMRGGDFSAPVLESVHAQNLKKTLISLGVLAGAMAVGAVFLAILILLPPPVSFAVIGGIIGVGLLASTAYKLYNMKDEILSGQHGKGDFLTTVAASVVLFGISAAAIFLSGGTVPAILGGIYLLISIIVTAYYIYCTQLSTSVGEK